MTEANLDELRVYHDAEKVAVWKKWYEEHRSNENGFNKTDEFQRMMKKVEEMILANA